MKNYSKVFHLTDMEWKKELSLFFIDLPGFMQLIWLAKEHKMYKPSPKRNTSKKKSNLMHTRHFHGHSLREQAHLTKSVFYLICTIIGSGCITFYFPQFFFLFLFLMETHIGHYAIVFSGHYAIVLRIKNGLKSL